MGRALWGTILDVARAIRFGVVGLTATAAYLALVNLLAVPVGPLAPFPAHLVALSSATVLSYAGHHSFTFRRKGGHGLYLSRFTLVTAGLFLFTSAVAFACDRWGHYPASVISVVVAILYPATSYLVHCLWTFAEGGKPGEKPTPLPF